VGGPDEREFDELVVSRAYAMRRTAYLMCGDWHQAEDIVQVAFMKLYAVWHRVQRQEAFDLYLRTTVVRACIDEKRRARWRKETLPGSLPEVASVSGQPDEARDVLVAALRRLAPGQRAVLVLRYFEDMSVQDTARALGCATGTVKSQTAKGLAAMRAMIGDFDVDVDDPADPGPPRRSGHSSLGTRTEGLA
jgi:RNA polymerase sigma-70 factor (sigma-E family)